MCGLLVSDGTVFLNPVRYISPLEITCRAVKKAYFRLYLGDRRHRVRPSLFVFSGGGRGGRVGTYTFRK